MGYYWHDANLFPPPPGYVNYKNKMDELISAIDQFNYQAGVPHMVKFHTEGDRKVAGEWQTCWKQWREFCGAETDYTELLHLKDEKRVKMFMRIYKYFFHRTYFPPVTAAAPATTSTEQSEAAQTEGGPELAEAA